MAYVLGTVQLWSKQQSWNWRCAVCVCINEQIILVGKAWKMQRKKSRSLRSFLHGVKLMDQAGVALSHADKCWSNSVSRSVHVVLRRICLQELGCNLMTELWSWFLLHQGRSEKYRKRRYAATECQAWPPGVNRWNKRNVLGCQITWHLSLGIWAISGLFCQRECLQR